MEKYELTPEAVSDLFEIWEFINRDNSGAAGRVEESCTVRAIFHQP
jgi:plasmid stabilization system protein ParE